MNFVWLLVAGSEVSGSDGVRVTKSFGAAAGFIAGTIWKRAFYYG